METTVELIEFTRPVSNRKNLYIAGIQSSDLNEAQIMDKLYEVFSHYGLVYEVQVFGGKETLRLNTTSKQSMEPSYYAFVKFYSYFAAQKARVSLNRCLKIGSQMCKVAFATRCKETDVGQTLYVAKCQELANFYLGFNGWTSHIKRMEEDKDAGQNLTDTPQVRFFCTMELAFPKQGLSTQGLGAWEETYSKHDPSSRATAIHKARKRSHQRAMEHAFSKVILVVLGNGKVSVEINTTKRDLLTDMQVARLADEQVLQVSELDEEPQLEESLEEKQINLDGTEDLDDANLHILQQLGDSFG